VTVLHQNNEDLKTMPPLRPRSPIQAALNFGAEKYTSIPVPILAIFACPHDWSHFFPNDPERKAARLAADTAGCSARADTFARGVPTARVVGIPNAGRHVYRSNEAQVIDEMKSFLAPFRRGSVSQSWLHFPIQFGSGGRKTGLPEIWLDPNRS
jgi:hypothetical protein